MKRFMAILFAVAVLSVTAAQAQIIHVKSTTITTTKAKKEKPKRKLTEHYQGFVDENFGFDTFYPKGFGFDLTTTHGYRFNDFLFVGAGTGLVLQKTNDFIFGDINSYPHSPYNQKLYPNAALGLPIYTAVRGYFTRAAIKPFAELRLGGIIALNTVHYTYNYYSPCFNPDCDSPVHHSGSHGWEDTHSLYGNERFKFSGLYSELAIGVEYKRLFAKIDLSCRRNIQSPYFHGSKYHSTEYRKYSTFLGIGIGCTF